MLGCGDRYSYKITQETVYPGSQLSMVKLRWEELEAAEQSGSREQGMLLPRSFLHLHSSETVPPIIALSSHPNLTKSR